MSVELQDLESLVTVRPPDEDHLVYWHRWLLADPPHVVAPSTGRVLLISYQFPPTGGSGVQRPAKLAKYLQRLGWAIEVLTASHDRFPWHDLSLLEDIPTECAIHRVSGHEPACLARSIAQTCRPWLAEANVRWIEDRLYWRLLRLTDVAGLGQGESLWIGPAVRAALRLHRRCPFDAMISTGPPHFVHRAALQIQQATGLHWLADLRDPLVSDFDRGDPTLPHVRTMRRLERAILTHATTVVTTCPALADDLRARYPHRPSNSIQSITNGFDRDDLRRAFLSGSASAEPCAVLQKTHPHSSECLFVAAGSLYGRREIGRMVAPLARVLDAHPEWSGRVRLVLAGSIDAQQRRRWERQKPDWLTLAGYVEHSAALRLAASAACNILMIPDCRHGRLSIPGKLFELIALPTHVLALAPESGDAARILRGAGASTVVPLEDADGVAEAMEAIICDHFAGSLVTSRDWSFVDNYDRAEIAARFAASLASTRGAYRP